MFEILQHRAKERQKVIAPPPCIVALLFAGLIWIGSGVGSSNVANAAGPTVEDSAPSPSELIQLKRCREGLLDPQASADQRRRWAELLFAFDTPATRGLIVDLLQHPNQPSAQQTLCEVLAERPLPVSPSLDRDVIDPLLLLLDSERESLRGAAADALAQLGGPEVAKKLGSLAGNAEAPMNQRLAAIDALAVRVYRREVVGVLMPLLGSQEPLIVERVVAAIEPASRETIGQDVQRWRHWWGDKQVMTDQAWLENQLQITQDRLRSVEQAMGEQRLDSQRRIAGLAQKLAGFQRDAFRSLGAEGQENQLTEWLADPLAEVRQTALGIIKARIADEGQRPSGEVLEALLGLLAEGSPGTRREVLLIVQTLSAPEVVAAVLSRLDQESNPAMRVPLFKAIGKLVSPAAIQALVLEIASPKSDPACVREAALALGQIAAHPIAREELADAVDALKNRLRQVTVDQTALRAALLSAMAGVGDARFGTEFRDAINSDDSDTLRPAIRGLIELDDRSQMPRLRTLVGSSDAQVRVAALDALATLGGEDADLEAVLTHLNPALESDETVRNAAWLAFRTLTNRQSVEDRFAAANRLRDLPELEARYLEELIDDHAALNGNDETRARIHDRLGVVWVNQEQHAKAAPHLRSLYELRLADRADGALHAGLRWLDAAFRRDPQGRLADVITQLATAHTAPADRSRIMEAVETLLASALTWDDASRRAKIIEELSLVSASLFDERWPALLGQAKSSNRATADTPVRHSSP